MTFVTLVYLDQLVYTRLCKIPWADLPKLIRIRCRSVASGDNTQYTHHYHVQLKNRNELKPLSSYSVKLYLS